MIKTTFKHKVLLVLFGIGITFLLLEILLNLGGWIFLFLQERSNKSHVNPDNEYRILCIGESTTAFWGKDSYPTQLEEILNKEKSPVRIKVFNKGVPGTTTTEIIENLDKNLDNYNPHMVIAMMGINDFFDMFEEKNMIMNLNHLNSKSLEFLLLIMDNLFFKFQEIYYLKQGLMLKLAKLYYEHGMLNKAEETLQDILYKDKKNKNAMVYLLNINMQRRKWAKIQIIADQLLEEKLMPVDKVLVIKAMALWAEYFVKGAYSPKIEPLCLEIIKNNPFSGDAYLFLSIYYRNIGDIQKAELMLKKSLELDSRYFSSIFLIEELYKLQHDRNKAEKKLLKEINAKGITPQVYFPLISYYNFLGEESKKESFINKTNLLYEEKFNPLTKLNYVKLKDILDRRKITLVVTQYPVLSVRPLRSMLSFMPDVPIVDNEQIFKNALKEKSFDQLFTDSFAGEFGHCTREGNRILAENIAKSVYPLIQQ